MAEISRRESLAMGAGLALSAFAGSGRASAAPLAPGPSLTLIAQTKRIRFGSSIRWALAGADQASFTNPTYAALVLAECGLIVPENELKAQVIRPDPINYDFSRFDPMLAWARSKGLAVRGHTLLWHQPQYMPSWMETYNYGTSPATAAAKILTGHINTVCARYVASIKEWDVVNEAVNPADGSLYSTALSRAMGGASATLDLAFRTAHTAAPQAKLVYNDYMSWEPRQEKHRAGVLALLRGFRTRGVPVHALGIQSHIVAQTTNVARDAAAQSIAWRAFLDEVVGMGYGLVVTELDVRDNNLPADIYVRDRAVADYAKAYLELMLSYPVLADIVVWGMCDRYTWLKTALPRADGLASRPCPYNSDYYAKAMRTGIANAITAAAPR